MLAKVMNWISRHILLAPFMCLFLLFACGSSHKAIKSNTEVISKDSASESVNIVHGSSTSLSELITTNSNYVIDFCIYDTRKPPDSLTGKPPLLADGHVEGDFSKNKRKETAIKDSTEVKADKETTSTKHEETKTEGVKDKKESTLLKQIGFACVCGHYKIFCVNGNTGFRNESRIFYFIHLQNEEAYERKESSSA